MMIVIAAIMKVIATNITEIIAANIIQVRGGVKKVVLLGGAHHKVAYPPSPS